MKAPVHQRFNFLYTGRNISAERNFTLPRLDSPLLFGKTGCYNQAYGFWQWNFPIDFGIPKRFEKSEKPETIGGIIYFYRGETTMTQRKAEALIALGLTLRGTSLLFSKLAMRTVGPFTLCGIRFIISFVVVAVIFHKQLRTATRKEVLHSAIVGLFYFFCMAFELLGLQTTPSSTTAFIENTAVVIVPLLAAIVYRRLPKRMDIICALIALVGIALMTLKGSGIHFTTGELLVLAGACSYAMTVITMDVVTANDNPLTIGIIHLFFIGFFSLIAAFLFEDFTIPTAPAEWGAILYLALVCGAIGFTIQPVGQKYTTPERTGLYTATNPLAAMVLGIIFLGERFTLTGILGCLLILLSIFLPSALQNGLLGKKNVR